VNNAAVQIPRDFDDDHRAASDVDDEILINFAAPIHLIGELLPHLRRQPQSSIINVTSGLAFSPLAIFPVYCATKAALHSFTLSLRHQLRGTQVEVIEMAPPIVATGLRSAEAAERNPAMRDAMTPEQFVQEALSQLQAGVAEVLVAHSAFTRREGDAVFEKMNAHLGAR
jgi:uncharacterized oxidoreductase